MTDTLTDSFKTERLLTHIRTGSGKEYTCLSKAEDGIKTDGKTAELYRRGAEEAAVLSIYGVKDRLLADGEIEYTAELDFPHRCEEVSIVYSNHGGAVYLEIEWQEGRSEIFLFE